MKQRLIYVTIATIVILASFGELASLIHTVWGFTPFQSTTTAQVPAQIASSQASEAASPQAASSKPTATASATPTGNDFVPTHIQIPAVGIDLPIVSVPLVNGTWEVHTGVANYAEGTSLVNPQTGNVGIYAHDRTNGFSRIMNLRTGDKITLSAQGHQVIYQVVTKTTVDPNKVDVFYPTDKPQLTLITCNGFFSVQRYMVTASLVTFN